MRIESSRPIIYQYEGISTVDPSLVVELCKLKALIKAWKVFAEGLEKVAERSKELHQKNERLESEKKAKDILVQAIVSVLLPSLMPLVVQIPKPVDSTIARLQTRPAVRI